MAKKSKKKPIDFNKLTKVLSAHDNFKKAFNLVREIHDECGDRNAWDFCYEQLSEDVKKYERFSELEDKMNFRTDISDDFRFEYENMMASMKVVYVIMGRQI